MEITSQLAVFLANKPGTLAAVCDELAKENIAVYALTVSDTTDHSVIRMIVSDPRKALHLLEEHGALVVENEVLVINAKNHPSLVAEIAKTLAKAGVNIEYAYLAIGLEATQGLLVLRVSDTKKAKEVLEPIVK